jgi:hypothetical protein
MQQPSPFSKFVRGAKMTAVLPVVVSIAACSLPPPSVPSQLGKSLFDAKAAISSCEPNAPQGATNAVVSSYIFSVVWGGILLGPIVINASEDQIRRNGARRAIDRCLEDYGYNRRELTVEESNFLNAQHGYQRQRFLNHLVAGGSLEEFSATQN